MYKQVWILNHYAQEPNHPGGTRHFYLAKYLRSHNWEASIIAASVEHPGGRQRLSPDETFRLDMYENIPILWLLTSSYHGNGKGRLRNMLAYTIRALQKSNTLALKQPDVIIGSSVHPLAALAGLILARRYKVPFVFEVRDLWPQTLIAMGRLNKNSLVARSMRTLEKFLYHRADRIITLLPHAHEYIIPLGIKKEKIVWIPNGVSLEDFSAPLSGSRPAVEKKIFTLMYLGSHGKANGLESLLYAMAIVNKSHKKSVFLRLIGAGPQKANLIALARQLELGNDIISFEDAIPKREIPRIASCADAFIVTVLNLPDLYQFGISMNKIYDYMAAARPIIIASGAINNPIEDAKCGVTAEPDNPKSLARAIGKLLSLSPSQRTEMGLAARKYVEDNHSYYKLTNSLAETLNEIVDESV